MTYWLMAALVTSAAVAIFWAGAELAIALVSRRVSRAIQSYAPADRAWVLFRLRALPLAAAVAAVAVVAPLYFWFEPPDSGERVPMTLVAAAMVGVVLIGRAAWRGVSGAVATCTVLLNWRRQADAVHDVDAPFPVLALDQPFPSVAIVGFVRPVLFMSTDVIRACPPDEVRAMIAHERAHVDARDNLKRLLLQMCPSIASATQRLDRAWHRAAEEAADAAAAHAPGQAVALASALVRVARVTASGPIAAPMSALYESGDVQARIHRLLGGPQPCRPRPSRPIPWLVGTMLCAVAIIVASPAIHRLMEAALARLP